jgi:phosphoglycerol transferase MdoB-like AlkP superfamily enzyme
MLRRVGDALAHALAALPALVAAWLCLRGAESLHAAGAGLPQSTLFGAAIGNDALALLRHAFLILLAALPLALTTSRRLRTVLLGLGWSALLCAHAALLHYHWNAGVPLGADLFAYSFTEIGTTVAGATAPGALLAGALLLALAVLWTLLLLIERFDWPRAGGRGVLVTLPASVFAFVLLPGHYVPDVVRSDAERDAIVNKSAWFADRSLAWLAGAEVHAAQAAQPTGRAPWEGSDPRYPFLRPERTPDTLGPLLHPGAGTPPKLVFIVVEGLGRTFSGPGARLGSFTPFLDELAGRSLYFENFLAPQGRTFGVLTSVFGSLPFGGNGLAALGERIPRHASLPSVLKAQGYATRFYSGSNVEFDNEAQVLRAMGVDDIVSERDFKAPYERANEWGYGDRDLMRAVLERERGLGAGPALTIVQTSGMHNPFTFPGLPAYRARVERRLAELNLAPAPAQVYRDGRDIFASILYLDDALRMFFEQAKSLPGYADTIFVVTGDHRLPELPMQTRLERYHVPLLMYSPRLKAPRAIKSVSSQFDLAPSLLAYLANRHGIQTPAEVSWLGAGLDTEPSFRNLHALPLKQTKTELSDFVSGTAYLAQDRLYTIGDGMAVDRMPDDGGALLDRARAQFASFLRANAQAETATALAPDGIALAPYGGERTLRGAPLLAEAGAVAVTGVRVRPGTGRLMIEATLTNHASTTSRPFAPLLVLSDERGAELGETALPARVLGAGESARIALQPAAPALKPDVYYVSVIPSHPESGRAAGAGQYHVRVQLD